MLIISAMGGALFTGHSAWPSRNFSLARAASGWKEVTILPKGSFSCTGRLRGEVVRDHAQSR